MEEPLYERARHQLVEWGAQQVKVNLTRGHALITGVFRDKTFRYFTSLTTSDRRAWKNHLSFMRRDLGIDDRPEKRAVDRSKGRRPANRQDRPVQSAERPVAEPVQDRFHDRLGKLFPERGNASGTLAKGAADCALPSKSKPRVRAPWLGIGGKTGRAHD